MIDKICWFLLGAAIVGILDTQEKIDNCQKLLKRLEINIDLLALKW